MHLRQGRSRVLIVAMILGACLPLGARNSASAHHGGLCLNAGNFFDGRSAVGGFNGNRYRGVVGNISTRTGFACNGDIRPEWNFTTAWYMLAGPPVQCNGGTNRGYSQAGYWRGNGQTNRAFAETNANGCGPVRRFFPNIPAFAEGSVHRYQEDWYPWSDVFASSVDGAVILYTDFNPLALWGQNAFWDPQLMGETTHFQSDISGRLGTSAFFHAIGSRFDGSNGWFGNLGLNGAANDNPARWVLGPVNEFPVNIHGVNFQVYTR